MSGIVEWTVTADVAVFLAGTSNHGWIVKKTEEGAAGRVDFASKENDVNPPELVITYTVTSTTQSTTQTSTTTLSLTTTQTTTASETQTTTSEPTTQTITESTTITEPTTTIQTSTTDSTTTTGTSWSTETHATSTTSTESTDTDAVNTQTSTTASSSTSGLSTTPSTTQIDPPQPPSQPNKPRTITITLEISPPRLDNSSGREKVLVKANPVTSDGACAHFTYIWKVDGGELMGIVFTGNYSILIQIDQENFVEAGTVEWTLPENGSHTISCTAHSPGYGDGKTSTSIAATPEFYHNLYPIAAALLLTGIYFKKKRQTIKCRE